ncbi:hypothetical protein KC878_00925, partial [Candidatus Saccharibacteria bacterium]|nr:hypothetical protein [Candidatus Saccharibacteria bacterium]
MSRPKISTSTLLQRAIFVLFAVIVPSSVLFGVLAKPAQAAPSSQLNFQARLQSNTGALIPDGNYHVEFKIYDSLASGASAQGVCSLDSSTDDCLWLET